MNNKRGFTLVEVLAIIVILAIIILISVPVYNIISTKVRRDIFKKSAQGLLKTTEVYYINNYEGKIDIGNTVFYCDGDKCADDSHSEKINYDGNLGYGKVTLDENGKVSFDITDNVYCAYKYANNDKIYVVDGTCDENNIDIVHDTNLPTIIQKDIITTPYTIAVNYEASDDIEVKEVVCSYGDSQDKLDKKGMANLNVCLMDSLLSSHEYYYKICAIDNGLNVSNPCIEGKTKTKAAISGTPTIVASWPSTSSIKVDVSGMTIDESDTVSYRYSVNGQVKQDWTTNSSYTYTGLTEGTSNKVLVETKATSGGDLGNNKEADIWTSKTVTSTNSGYSSSSSCSSSTKTIAASDVYSSVTLTGPSCSSYTEIQSKYCSTSRSGYSSCSSSRTCSLSGGSGTISLIDQNSNEECNEECGYEEDDDCFRSCAHDFSVCSRSCVEDTWACQDSCGEDDTSCQNDCIYDIEEPCIDSCRYDSNSCHILCPEVYVCEDVCDTYTTCEYGGNINVTVTLYTATYSGVVSPSQTTY